jgi:hypothetical protein
MWPKYFLQQNRFLTSAVLPQGNKLLSDDTWRRLNNGVLAAARRRI